MKSILSIYTSLYLSTYLMVINLTGIFQYFVFGIIERYSGKIESIRKKGQVEIKNQY